MKIALAQINSTVGDFEGNISKMVSFVEKARNKKAELLVFPVSALAGNPLYDLPHRPEFTEACREALNKFLPYASGIGVLLGLGLSLPTFGKDGKKALLIENGQIIAHTGQLGLLEFGKKKIGYCWMMKLRPMQQPMKFRISTSTLYHIPTVSRV